MIERAGLFRLHRAHFSPFSRRVLLQKLLHSRLVLKDLFPAPLFLWMQCPNGKEIDTR